MASFLTPDAIHKVSVGGEIMTIREKIIPDSARATKNVASYVQKGEPMKPLLPLHGDGKPQGITVHNTNDITVPQGTNPAEQYTRATWPNQNMGGVCVHFYVWKAEIWQNLKENEQGWHATDGASRRASQRKGKTIGGNLDTIAIECIGKDSASEDATAKLCAYLCKKYALDPDIDIYQHNYFYPSKNCPEYIRPNWSKFLAAVKNYCRGDSQSPEAALPTQSAVPAAALKIGDTVQFQGGYHYASSDAAQASGATAANGGKRTAGKAKLTAIAAKAKHPYHLVGMAGGSDVYGWVDAVTVAAPDPADADYSAAGNGLKVGDKVKIKPGAAKYARSTVQIPDWVKQATHTVAQIGTNDVLLREIYSWVSKEDVEGL